MKISLIGILLICLSLSYLTARADQQKANKGQFKKVMVIVFENTNYEEALQQPFFSSLAKNGALFSNMMAEAHPSQANYIALTSGSTGNVTSNAPVELNDKNIVDLLESAGKTWKAYAEGYPGNCYTEASSGTYFRKHVPFLSYNNIRLDAQRCSRIVPAEELDRDLLTNQIPDYSFYTPDILNDGHDTNVVYADQYLQRKFGPLLKSPQFMKDMLFIVTFDENDDSTIPNQIYTAIYGNSVIPGSIVNQRHDHYSLLKLIEDVFGLESLGKNDASAAAITGIWR